MRRVAIKTDMVSTRWQIARTSAMALSLTLAAASVVSQTRGEPLTLVSPEGRGTIATVRVDGLDMVALEHLAVIFQLAVNEDRATGSLTVSYQDRDIVLSPEQGLASVAGRLVDLPAPPVRTPQGWLVPVEFVSRALALVYDQNLELRRPSRLVIVGEVHIPQITVREEHLDNQVRVNFEIAPATDYTVVQEGGQLIVQFEADVIDAILPRQRPWTTGGRSPDRRAAGLGRDRSWAGLWLVPCDRSAGACRRGRSDHRRLAHACRGQQSATSHTFPGPAATPRPRIVVRHPNDRDRSGPRGGGTQRARAARHV